MSFKILNAVGRTVKTIATRNERNLKIDISQLSAGVYFAVCRKQDAIADRVMVIKK